MAERWVLLIQGVEADEPLIVELRQQVRQIMADHQATFTGTITIHEHQLKDYLARLSEPAVTLSRNGNRWNGHTNFSKRGRGASPNA